MDFASMLVVLAQYDKATERTPRYIILNPDGRVAKPEAEPSWLGPEAPGYGSNSRGSALCWARQWGSEYTVLDLIAGEVLTPGPKPVTVFPKPVVPPLAKPSDTLVLGG